MAEQITSSQIASFGDGLEPGNYIAKLTKIEVKESEKVAAYLSIGLEIIAGEAEGLTATMSIFPKVTKSPKNGKYYSRGIFEAQQMAAAWGKPLPEFPLDGFIDKVTDAAARQLQKLLAESFRGAGSPKLKIAVVPEKKQEKNETTGKWGDAKDDEGNPIYVNRTYIRGRHQAQSATIEAKSDGTVETPVTPATETFV